MKLRIELRSDSAFGRGDGIAGLVDREVEHDARTGLPFIKGRTVKGLLVEACADLLYALKTGNNQAAAELEQSARKLFGIPGSTMEDTGCLHVGAALLPDDLRQYFATEREKFTPHQLLQGFTTIRYQTAVDAATDGPKHGSLRATRVVLRRTVFYAQLHSDQPLDPVDEQLLAACTAGMKYGGQNRTRGTGWLKVQLVNSSEGLLESFIERIGGAI